MADADILARITALADEEHAIRAGGEPDPERLAHLEETLDQCWDLLRQHRARRENHEPDTAAVRSVDTVEHYQQ